MVAFFGEGLRQGFLIGHILSIYWNDDIYIFMNTRWAPNSITTQGWKFSVLEDMGHKTP